MNETRKNTADEILFSAAQEFAKHGLEGARIDRIAKNAGVNKAMIYYHFKSKDQLYQTIIDIHLNKIRNFFRERMTTAASPEETFRAISEFYNTQFVDRTFIPVMLREIAAGSNKIVDSLAEFIAKGPAVKLNALINEQIGNGTFRPIDSRQALVSFIGMNMFYIIMSPLVNQILELKDEKEFREKRPDAILDLFWNGIKAK